MEASESSHASGSGSQSPPRPRACRECAKAKAKCSLDTKSAPGATCDRCSRLKKDCSEQEIVPRKRQKTNRVAQLEQRLENITALLQPPHSAPSTGGAEQSRVPLTPEMSDTASPYTAFLANGTDAATSRSVGATVVESPQQINSARLSIKRPAPAPGLDSKAELDTLSVLGDSDTLLEQFRNRMAPHFPFVVIPDNVDAATLAKTRPFLLKAAVLAAVNKDVDASLRLEDELVKHLSERMILRGERSLDLLQGLLVYIAWYQFHFLIARQLTTLQQLAIAMMAELGINRAPTRLDDFERGVKSGWEGQPEPTNRTLDERRAYAGCFYLSSVFAGFHKKLDALRWTPYMDECCTVLENTHERDGDLHLVHIVRLQQLRETIAIGFPSDRPVPYDFAGMTGMSIKSFLAELAQIRRNEPPNIQCQAALNIHYLDIELQLYEVAFAKTAETSNSQQSNLRRIKYLSDCLSSTRSFFSIWFTIKSEDYYDLSYASHIHAAHGIIILYRLSTFEDPMWDLDEVRSVLDFSGTIDQLQAALERAQAAAGDLASEKHVFGRTCRPLKMFKDFCEKKQHPFDMPPPQSGSASAEETPMPNLDMDGLFDGLNAPFWDEMFSQWDPSLSA